MVVNLQVGAYDGQSVSWSLWRSIIKLELKAVNLQVGTNGSQLEMKNGPAKGRSQDGNLRS